MLRITFIIYLLLFAFDSIGQSKTTKSFSISPISVEFDSSSIGSILINEYAKRLSNSLILISQETTTSNSGAELYYKKDSITWFGIHIDYDNIEVDTVNLDNAGRPELILKCKGYIYGSGGGDGTGAFIVFNIDKFPLELMNVKNFCSEEAFSRTYGDNPEPTPGYFGEYERQISCENRSIIINRNSLSALKEYKETTGYDCDLTQIPSGVYKMIEGRLTLVSK
jgi:hypothetical protein